jgi:hypothetical protein
MQNDQATLCGTAQIWIKTFGKKGRFSLCRKTASENHKHGAMVSEKRWLTRGNERIDGNTIIHCLEHCKEVQPDAAQWNKPSCSTFTKLGVVHLWRLVCCEWCRSKKRRKVISCLYTVSNASVVENLTSIGSGKWRRKWI